MRSPPSHGPDDAGGPEHRAEEALVLAPLRGGEEVGNDGERRGEDARAAQALQGPEHDQLRHAAATAPRAPSRRGTGGPPMRTTTLRP